MNAPKLAGRRDGDILAVIPARNEAVRLPAALAPLHAAGIQVLVVANGCWDGTAAVARAHGATVLETVGRSGGVGAARRDGMALALTLAPRPEMILTTDADCVFTPTTLPTLRAALRRADAAFGRVEPDPAEFADLPLPVRIHGRLEDRYDALVAHIEGMRADLPWDPLPRHNQSPGALIAFRPDTYRSTGGFEPVCCHEDRYMSETLLRIGAKVARPWDAVVHASCRLSGRAAGGMAATIAARTRRDLSGETEWLQIQCHRLERIIARLDRSEPEVRERAWRPTRIKGFAG